MFGSARLARIWLLTPLVAGACSYERVEQGPTQPPSGLIAGTQKISIEPAPDGLRGRVAVPAGARVYARPSYASPSWTLTLAEPPLAGGDEIPRARALRVVGIVRARDGTLGGAGDFLALTNDLDGEDPDAPTGCGPRLEQLEHLRLLVYVPIIHLAPVTTRALEVDAFTQRATPDRLRLGAGVRVAPLREVGGLPPLPAGVHWRSIDGDGVRVLAAIPDDAVGLAWDPGRVPEFDDAGEALVRDAEGSTLWLRDEGGASVELTLRSACAEQRSIITRPEEVAAMRELALDAFYDQRPRLPPEPVVEDAADYRIPAGTPLRWTDGELAGETLADWSVAIGVGQTWDGRRCFSLPLGAELRPVAAPALACVDPNSLELLADGAGFGVVDELELGGSVELGPAAAVDGGPWDEQALRVILNGRHESVAECLRPLLERSEGLVGARWDLRLRVDEGGRVDEVEVEARGPSHDAVDDCLRAEAFTWLLPSGAAGQLEVPVTVGVWADAPDLAESAEPEQPEPEQPDAREPERERERGKVIIIRDEEPEQLEPGE